MAIKTVADINQYSGSSVNPLEHPEQLYELYSVPSFETGYPEIVKGKDIGSTKITVEEGDVLVCKINPRINRVWVVKHNTEYPLLASSEWIVVRNRNIDSNYLKWYFSSPTFRTLLNSHVAGIGGSLTRAQPKQVAKYPVPVSSHSEQQKVSENLDKVNELIALRKEQLTKLDQLVKSRFIELFGDPKDNPKGYSKKQLKDTCRVITGNTPSRAVSEYYGDHIEWIKTDNIVSGLLNPTTATESLSEKGMAVSRTVESGAILMACIAGSIASIGRVCVTDRKVAFNQQINAIVPSDYNILFLYVMLQISKEYLVDEINMALKGILSKSKLEEKTFYVPPIELQEQFAAFVEQTDKSKLAIQQSLDKLELLKKALMQEYFG